MLVKQYEQVSDDEFFFSGGDDFFDEASKGGFDEGDDFGGDVQDAEASSAGDYGGAVDMEEAKEMHVRAIRDTITKLLNSDSIQVDSAQLKECIDVMKADLEEITELYEEKSAEFKRDPKSAIIEFQKVDFNSKRQCFQCDLDILAGHLSLMEHPKTNQHTILEMIQRSKAHKQRIIEATFLKMSEIQERF